MRPPPPCLHCRTRKVARVEEGQPLREQANEALRPAATHLPPGNLPGRRLLSIVCEMAAADARMRALVTVARRVLKPQHRTPVVLEFLPTRRRPVRGASGLEVNRHQAQVLWASATRVRDTGEIQANSRPTASEHGSDDVQASLGLLPRSGDRFIRCPERDLSKSPCGPRCCPNRHFCAGSEPRLSLACTRSTPLAAHTRDDPAIPVP